MIIIKFLLIDRICQLTLRFIPPDKFLDGVFKSFCNPTNVLICTISDSISALEYPFTLKYQNVFKHINSFIGSLKVLP